MSKLSTFKNTVDLESLGLSEIERRLAPSPMIVAPAAAVVCCGPDEPDSCPWIPMDPWPEADGEPPA